VCFQCDCSTLADDAFYADVLDDRLPGRLFIPGPISGFDSEAKRNLVPKILVANGTGLDRRSCVGVDMRAWDGGEELGRSCWGADAHLGRGVDIPAEGRFCSRFPSLQCPGPHGMGQGSDQAL
jgi:hypothetical protein